jgi:hypothetical protein
MRQFFVGGRASTNCPDRVLIRFFSDGSHFVVILETTASDMSGITDSHIHSSGSGRDLPIKLRAHFFQF